LGRMWLLPVAEIGGASAPIALTPHERSNVMTDIDLAAEIREYQWRRKFESGTRRPVRFTVIVPIVVLVVSAIASANLWW
jgi:hypothetical protein